MKFRDAIERHYLHLALRESSITGKTNKHMTHIEDLVILGGAEGIDHALDTFNALYDELKGETPRSERRVSVKIDGAPAVFVWNSFPGLDGPGVSTKSIFGKTPKVAHTPEQVQQHFGHSPDLAAKLIAMLQHVPELGIPDGQIWQGDFLYDKASLGQEEIDGEPYIIFHPNTIVYAVPQNSDIGRRVLQSDVGVVWHTVYSGESLDTVQASFSAKAENLNNVPAVFSTDPYVKSIAGTVTMTAEETAQVDSLLEKAEAQAAELTARQDYAEVVANEDFVSSFFTVFQNATIRSGQKTPDPETFIPQFTKWAVDKVRTTAEKKIEKLKTEKGKERARQKMEIDLDAVQSIIDDYTDVLILIVELIQTLTTIKEIITRKLDALGSFDAYLRMKSGEFRKTGQEGFAASDITGNVVKFVDRTEFSYANFSPDVVKGWESPSTSRSSVDGLSERGYTSGISTSLEENMTRRIRERVSPDLFNDIEQRVNSVGFNIEGGPTQTVVKARGPVVTSKRGEAALEIENAVSKIKSIDGTEVGVKGTTPFVGVVADDGSQNLRIEVKSNKDMGRSAGAETSKESIALRAIQDQMRSAAEANGGDFPLIIGDSVYENAAMIENVPGVPKADFALVDSVGAPLAYISHKAGSSPLAFQQYGGMKDQRPDNEDIIEMAQQVYDIVDGEFPPKTYFIKEISEALREEVASRALYGRDVGAPEIGVNNVQFLIQGDMALVEDGGAHRLEAHEIVEAPALPLFDSPYFPVYLLRFSTQPFRIGGIRMNARLMVINRAKAYKMTAGKATILD